MIVLKHVRVYNHAKRDRHDLAREAANTVNSGMRMVCCDRCTNTSHGTQEASHLTVWVCGCDAYVLRKRREQSRAV